MEFDNIRNAYGLTEAEKKTVGELVDAYNNNKAKNAERIAYYEDKTQVSFAGITLRDEFLQNVRTNVGWCAKGVDLLASRSVFDSFSVDGEPSDELNAVLADNDFAACYSRAVPVELAHGYGVWAVGRGGEGEPDAMVSYYNGENSAALWDYRRNRVEAALLINDYERRNGGKELLPNYCTLHTERHVVEIMRSGDAWRVVERQPNSMGRCMIVPMCFRPNMNPLGKSRITNAAKRITDNMQREIFLMNVHSKKYSLPKWFITNASDEFMDAADKAKLSMDEITVVGKDSDGESVNIQQLNPASPETHIAIMDKLAQEMAAEFGVPASVFGVDTSKTYVSNDALTSSRDELIAQARQLNSDNGKALKQLARMVMAVIENKPYSEVEHSIEIHWMDESMPTMSQIADAMVKQVSMMPWLAETDVILEQLGYDAPTRQRLMRQKSDAMAASTLNAILLGKTSGGESVAEPGDANTTVDNQ